MKPLKRSLEQSNAWWDRALKVIMDGTQLYSKGPNVSVKGVTPIYLKRGKGSHSWDVDGNEYIDFSMGVGSLFLGYGYPRVLDAVRAQLEDGTNLSLVHPLEVEAAERLVKHIPSAEKVRFLKTGSDATTAATRLARAFTGRDRVIKGEYHGWMDWCMANTKRNAGIPKVLRDHVLYMEYNRLDQAKEYFARYKGEIACVITEAVELEEPRGSFLSDLKALCHENGALLIFDEVVTGFRFGLSGAQGFFGVTPDMAVFGKAMANGMPLSAVVGRAEIFDTVHEKVFISTTFGGETLSLAAACACMDEIAEKDAVAYVWRIGQRLKDGTNELLKRHGLPVQCIGYAPRINLSFMEKFDQPSLELKTLFLQEVTKRGILMGWTMFPSFTHTDEDINQTLEAFEDAAAICEQALREENVAALLEGPLAVAVDVL
jgi:glutamate-1-semialdehyde aminotransferase